MNRRVTIVAAILTSIYGAGYTWQVAVGLMISTAVILALCRIDAAA